MLQELTGKGVGVVLSVLVASLVDAVHMHDLLSITLKFYDEEGGRSEE